MLPLSPRNDLKVEMPKIYDIKEITDNINADNQETSSKQDLSNILENQAATDNVLSIKLQIDDNFEKLSSTELNSLSEKCRNKSIVILLTAKDSDTVYVYWKSKDIDNILILKHYSENYSQDDKKIYEFVAEFLTKSLSKGELGELS